MVDRSCNQNEINHSSLGKTLYYKETSRIPGPSSFQLMAKPVGPSCNLDCTYCYYLEKNKLFPGTDKYRMSDDLLEQYIEQYIGSVNTPVVTFVWQGGEPTLAGIDFYKRAVNLQKRHAGNKKIENSFQTNGTRLNEEWCGFFHENNFLVGISVDGPGQLHDLYRKTASGRSTFDQVKNSIGLLLKYHVEFNTLTCVTSFNAEKPLEIYHFLKDEGSRFIQFQPVVERRKTGGTKGELSLVSNEFEGDAVVTDWSVNAVQYGKFLIDVFDEWIRHDVGKIFILNFEAALNNFLGLPPGICVFDDSCGEDPILEFNGDVYPCDHFVYPEYLLGNIYKKSLPEVLESPKLFEFGAGKHTGLPGYCNRCKVKYACNGECPKHRISKTGDGEPGLNWLCEGYKMFFLHAERFLQRMAKELEAERPPSNVMDWARKVKK